MSKWKEEGGEGGRMLRGMGVYLCICTRLRCPVKTNDCHGSCNRWVYGWMGGWMNGWVAGWVSRQTDRLREGFISTLCLTKRPGEHKQLLQT